MLTICSFPNYAHRFRLEVEVKDDTNQTVVVLWDETATDLTKSSAKALLDELEQVLMPPDLVYVSMLLQFSFTIYPM